VSAVLNSAVSQPGFDPSDVPFQSFRTMDEKVRKAMLPDSGIKTVDLHEEKDGDQPVKFNYISVMAEMKRMLANPTYSGKMYTHFEYEDMRFRMRSVSCMFSES